MTVTRLGGSALRILETELDSFEKLEIVRAVRRDSDSVQDRRALAERMRLDPDELDRSIDELVASAILTRAATRLVLGERGRAPAVEELMTAYDEDQLVVVQALSALSVGRMRNMAATAFADAFVVRKRGPNNG